MVVQHLPWAVLLQGLQDDGVTSDGGGRSGCSIGVYRQATWPIRQMWMVYSCTIHPEV
jgi:hypothetical protein